MESSFFRCNTRTNLPVNKKRNGIQHTGVGTSTLLFLSICYLSLSSPSPAGLEEIFGEVDRLGSGGGRDDSEAEAAVTSREQVVVVAAAAGPG
jgi:hypothetical protein